MLFVPRYSANIARIQQFRMYAKLQTISKLLDSQKPQNHFLKIRQVVNYFRFFFSNTLSNVLLCLAEEDNFFVFFYIIFYCNSYGRIDIVLYLTCHSSSSVFYRNIEY